MNAASNHFITRIGSGLAAAGLVLVLCLGLSGTGCKGQSAGSGQLEKAEKLIASGDYEQAFMALNAALAEAPQDPNVHINLGWLYLYTDNIPASQSELKRVEQLAPDMAEVFHLRGALYQYQAQAEVKKQPEDARKNEEAAITNFKQALERDTKNERTYFDLATSLSALGRNEETLKVLDEGFDTIPPQDLETQVNFQIASCSAYAALQMYDEAAQDCRQALKFTQSPESCERIEEMIENMQLLNPQASESIAPIRPEDRSPVCNATSNAAGK